MPILGTGAPVLVLTFLVGSGCAQPDGKSYPPAPSIGSVTQQRRLVELARDAATEVDPSRRVEILLELRSHMHTVAREAGTVERPGDIAHDELERFVIETAYTAVRNGDYKGGGFPPPEEDMHPTWLASELVALRITEPYLWLDVLRSRMNTRNSLAGRMARAAGAFDTGGSPYPRFSHLTLALSGRERATIIQSDEFDGLIMELFLAEPFAAFLWLLQVEKTIISEAALEEYIALRRELLAVEAHLDDVLARYQQRRAHEPGPPAPFPYGEQSREMLRSVAERPEWSVHLYLLTVMNQGGRLWRDEEVIKRIAAHNNPVSMRFLAHYGLIAQAAPEAQPPKEKN